MAITLSNAARSAAADAIVDLVDAGAADASGDLVLMTAAEVEVARLALSDPAFGDAVDGVVTANAITNDPSANGHADPVALFKVLDKDNVEIWRGTVGTPDTDADLKSATTIWGRGHRRCHRADLHDARDGRQLRWRSSSLT